MWCRNIVCRCTSGFDQFFDQRKPKIIPSQVYCLYPGGTASSDALRKTRLPVVVTKIWGVPWKQTPAIGRFWFFTALKNRRLIQHLSKGILEALRMFPPSGIPKWPARCQDFREFEEEGVKRASCRGNGRKSRPGNRLDNSAFLLGKS